MTATQIRDALALLSDRELELAFHALPRRMRNWLRDALHSQRDHLAYEEQLR